MNSLSDFAIDFNKYRDLNFEQFLADIDKLPGKLVCTISVLDLFSLNNAQNGFGHGVYLFFRDSQVRYVGKNSSRTFLERIPAHFDIRADSWFNTLVRAESEVRRRSHNDKNKFFGAICTQILSTYKLKFIMFPSQTQKKSDTKLIHGLESLLRSYFESPLLNMTKRRFKKADIKEPIMNCIKKARKSRRKRKLRAK